jgi:hypothetical protein
VHGSNYCSSWQNALHHLPEWVKKLRKYTLNQVNPETVLPPRLVVPEQELQKLARFSNKQNLAPQFATPPSPEVEEFKEKPSEATTGATAVETKEKSEESPADEDLETQLEKANKLVRDLQLAKAAKIAEAAAQEQERLRKAKEAQELLDAEARRQEEEKRQQRSHEQEQLVKIRETNLDPSTLTEELVKTLQISFSAFLDMQLNVLQSSFDVIEKF